MKKVILSMALAFSSYASAQVGIGTSAPKATLDIRAKIDETIRTPDGLLIPRISRLTAQNVTTDLNSDTTPEESTLIYVNDISNGTAEGVTEEIDTKGFYFYSRTNSKWIKIYNNPDSSTYVNSYDFENGLTPTLTNGTNIVRLGGDLSNDTFINTNAENKLRITGNVPDLFSVDGKTFSVDGSKNSVGIGTTNPQARLHIDNTEPGTPSIQIVDGTQGVNKVLTSDASGVGTWQDLPGSSSAIGANNGLSSSTDNGITTVQLGGDLLEDTTITNDGKKLAVSGGVNNAFSVDGATFSVDGAKNSVGIGTITPQKSLHVTGTGLQLGAPLYVGGTDTTVGNAGTAGYVLVSRGDNSSPEWQAVSLDGGGTTNISAVGENGISVLTNDGTATVKLGGSLKEDTTITATETPTAVHTLAVKGDVVNAFSVQSTTKTNLSIDNKNDRVGIGTNSPSTALHVVGQVRITGGDPASGRVLTASSTTGLATWQVPNSSTASNGLTPTIASNVTTVKLGGDLTQDTSIKGGNGTNNNYKLSIDNSVVNGFSAGGTAFSVDTSGKKVGIGTNSPSTALHVVGQVRITGGDPAAKKVLTASNNTGLATWESLPTDNTTYDNAISKDLNNVVTLGGSLIKKTIIHTNGEKIIFNKTNDDISPAVYIDSDNKVGFGTNYPNTLIHIKTTEGNGIKIEDGTQGNEKILTSNANGVGTWQSLSKLRIPEPAIFELKSDKSGFLAGIGEGSSEYIPMKLIVNAIEEITVNVRSDRTDITFKPGIYQFTYVYEGSYTSASCTLSSYFVDFPVVTGGRPYDDSQRIHSTSSHASGSHSNHGGTISFTTVLTEPSRTWTIALGKGQSGNCENQTDLFLSKGSNQLTILRMGDVPTSY